jgi:hypothetical protein
MDFGLCRVVHSFVKMRIVYFKFSLEGGWQYVPLC